MSPRRLSLRIALALGGIALGWLLFEAAARVALGAPASGEERIAYFSPGFWQLRDGAVRYAPERSLRAVAVYGERIEYDVRFETNDLGFVDDRDYASGPPAGTTTRYAFVGDSFTAGVHGGEGPWPAALRASARAGGNPIEIYNLGVDAASLEQFAALLRSVRGEIAFDRLVFLFIGDDLLRFAWKPVEVGRRIVTCPLDENEQRCAARPSRMRTLPSPDATHEEILADARASGLQGGSRAWRERVLGSTHAGAAWTRWQRARERDARGPLRIDLGPWLRGLAQTFGKRAVTFLHIPERHETRAGRYAIEPGTQIEAAGFRYVPLLDACDFTRGDYLPIDGHFGAQGYAKLARCVGHVLGLLPDEAPGRAAGNRPGSRSGSGGALGLRQQE